MSRSFKKIPYCGDIKHNKKVANHRVRRIAKHDLDTSIDGCHYKKMFEQYDISDYGSTCSFNKYLSYYRYNKADGLYYDDLYTYKHKPIEKYTRKQLYSEWYKMYKRK